MSNPRHREVIAFAEIVARLAHRFTDREGLLDARGLTEGDVARMETAALEVIEQDPFAGSVFTRSFIEARRTLMLELVDEDVASTVVRRSAPASTASASAASALLDATIHEPARSPSAQDGFIEPALMETLLSGVVRGSK